eukprot:223186_1
MSFKRKIDTLIDKFITDDTFTINNEPPQKIQKTISSLSTSLFSNINDINQFKSIYNALNTSIIIKQYHIPTDIIKEISEFATGIILLCTNHNCPNEVLILNSTKPKDLLTHFDCLSNDSNSEYEYQTMNSIQYIYNKPTDPNDLNTNTQIICKQCCPKFKNKCDKQSFDSDDILFCSKLFYDNYCICGEQINHCNMHRAQCEFCKQDTCWSGYGKCQSNCLLHKERQCVSCQKIFCQFVDGIMYCKDCKKYVCKQCILKRCDCEKEEGMIGCFTHKECVSFYKHAKHLIGCQCRFDCKEKTCCCWNEFNANENEYESYVICIKCDKIYSEQHVKYVWFICKQCEEWCGHVVCMKCYPKNQWRKIKSNCEKCDAKCRHKCKDIQFLVE